MSFITFVQTARQAVFMTVPACLLR